MSIRRKIEYRPIILSTEAPFITYVRTQMFFKTRLKGIDEDLKVYINSKEVDRYFPFPTHNKKKEIETLVSKGELEVTIGKSKEGYTLYYYEALLPGLIDISYIKPKPQSTDPVIIRMKQYLLMVSLKQGTPSSPYFDAFLKFRDKFMDVFFTEDEFCGRVHTPVSSFSSDYRPNILIGNKETVSLDVATMQPLLLGRILKNQIGENEFSTWIDSGQDVYVMLKEKAGLDTREDGKKRFFEILFSKPNEDLADFFGNADWITWINEFKCKEILENPHTKNKPHSNLAWLLQTTEVKLMRKVWTNLVKEHIPFLTVHDEIIVKKEDARQTESIFRKVLRAEFKAFKLNFSEPIDALDPPIHEQQPKPLPLELPIQETFEKSEPQGKTISPQSESLLNLRLFKTEQNEPKKEHSGEWDQTISELENYFKGMSLPTHSKMLNQCSTITDFPLFIESHFAIVKAHNGNRTFLPYLKRLQDLRQILTSQNC